MRGLHALLFTLTVSVLCATVFAQQRPSPPPYQLIVHPSNPTGVVERKFLEEAFLKKITRWPNGELIRPVDLVPDSPVRRKFSDDVLNRSVEAVKGYWQQRIFSGRDIPPPELDNDEGIVKFVLAHEGAVGYVSGSAKIDGAKILIVR
jgi:hypothetical protein